MDQDAKVALFGSRGWVFRVKLSDEDLRVVAMATSFGYKIAIKWLYLNDSDYRQLLMEGV